MQDRVPLYPGRVKLTPVAGQDNVYDMVRADQPTQEGTPLNKDSLLKDATAALFDDLPENPVPDDVLQILSKAALVNNNGEFLFPSGESINMFSFGSGYYYGTGNGDHYISFEVLPEIIIVISPSGEANSNFAIIQKTNAQEYLSAGFNYYTSGAKAMFSVNNCTVSGNSISIKATSLGSGSLNQHGLLYNYFYLYYGVSQ